MSMSVTITFSENYKIVLIGKNEAYKSNITFLGDNREEIYPGMVEEKGRIIVPLRGIFEIMKARVLWAEAKTEKVGNRETSTAPAIIIIKDNTVIKLVIGEEKAHIWKNVSETAMKWKEIQKGCIDYKQVEEWDNLNKDSLKSVLIDTPPQIMSGRTYIPIRFIGETLGAKVSWEDNTVTIEEGKLPSPIITNLEDDILIDKTNYNVKWNDVIAAQDYTVRLRDITTDDEGPILFDAKTTDTSYTIQQTKLEFNHKYRFAVAACLDGFEDGWTQAIFKTSLNGVKMNTTFNNVEKNIFEFKLTSDYYDPNINVAVQFKVSDEQRPDEQWMDISDVMMEDELGNKRFVLDYQGATAGEHTHRKQIRVTLQGERVFRFLIVDKDNNILYTVPKEYKIDSPPLMSVTKSGNDDLGYIHIKDADLSISSVKIFINGIMVSHYSRLNGIFDADFKDYEIDKHQYEDGVYTVGVYGCAYQTDEVLSAAPTLTFSVDNPLAIKSITPLTLKKGDKTVTINGSGLKYANVGIHINGKDITEVLGGGTNSLVNISVQDHSQIVGDLPDVFDSTTQDYNVLIYATHNNKWAGPEEFVTVERRTSNISGNVDTVLNYMRKMAKVEYKLNNKINFYSQSEMSGKNRKLYFPSGTTLKGILYTWSGNRSTTNLKKFEDSIKDGYYTGPSGYGEYLGNDCSSAILHAWHQVDNSVETYGNTDTMTGRKISNTTVFDLKTVLDGKTLKPGDAIEMVNHVILVSSVDNNAKTLTYIDQHGVAGMMAVYEGNKPTTNTSWYVDRSVSFDWLLSNGYRTVIRLNTLQEASGNSASGNGRIITPPETITGVVNGTTRTLYPKDKWYAFQNTSSGTVKDANGRYKIVVGPRIIKPNYSDSGKIWASDFNFPVYIDVVLTHKKTGESKTIECYVSAGCKAHTYKKYPDNHPRNNYYVDGTASFNVDSGLYQTGIAYPNSSNVNTEPQLALGNIDSSSIEFWGTKVDFTPGDYRLEQIIVK